ncbi:MAG TPA: heat-inducible transcriptional repressor HrcA [Gammaproteobacteria bacterium]|nr:heat-inducible transcriptional repressor HrcA [Gammaproteobacteria bacterium]
MTAESELNERAQHLLKVLIDRYVHDGEPVGSRTLARDSRLDLSPATVRNVMADLEETGFVRSPHTSAGRVPTVKGYRFFVDSLLTVKPLESVEVGRLRAQLDLDVNMKELVGSVSNMLSGLTRLAGVVTLPRRDHAALRRIEFLPLSENRVLAILVFSEREVQNRIIHTERAYSQAELQRAANYLTEHLAGKDLTEVRRSLIHEMQETRETVNRIMAHAVRMAEQVFSQTTEEEDYVVAGQTNLMDFRELCDVDKLRHLFEAFNEKREILHLLDQCVKAQGVQIFIGEESGYQVLDECSVVTAPYAVDDRVVGVLGVIGPTRMAYDRVIPIVDTTARLLGAALNPRD